MSWFIRSSLVLGTILLVISMVAPHHAAAIPETGTAQPSGEHELDAGASEFEDQAKTDEAEEQKKKNCPVPKYRPLKDTSRYIQAAYIAEAKQQLGNQTGQWCYEIYMSEGTKADVAPLQDLNNQENVCVNGTCYDEDGNSWPDPNAETSCTNGNCVDADGNEWKEPVTPNTNQTANPNQDSSGMADPTEFSNPAPKPGQQPSVYGDEFGGTSDEDGFGDDGLYEVSNQEDICRGDGCSNAQKAGSVGDIDSGFEKVALKADSGSDDEFGSPVNGGMTEGHSAHYGFRCRAARNGVCTRPSTHKGMDFYPKDYNNPEDRKVVAMKDGKVAAIVKNSQGYGKYVSIYHGKDANGNDVYTRTAHIEPNPNLKVGQQITKGTEIGKITGSGTKFGAAVNGYMREGMSQDQAYQRAISRYTDSNGNWTGNRFGVTAPHAHVEFTRQATGPGSRIAVDPRNYTNFKTGVNYAIGQGTGSGTAVVKAPSAPSGGGQQFANVTPNTSVRVPQISSFNPVQSTQSVANNLGQALRTGDTSGLVKSVTGLFTGSQSSGGTNPLSGLGSSNPLSGLGNFTGSGSSQPGIMGALSNLMNQFNPLKSLFGSSGSSGSSQNPYNYSSNNTNQNELNNINTNIRFTDLQLNQLDQLEALLNEPESSHNTARIKSLLQQQKREVEQFKQQNPNVDQRLVNDAVRYIDSQLRTADELEQAQQNVAQTKQIERMIKDRRSRQGFDPSPAPSDLAAVALKAEKTLNNEYRFRGSLSRTLVNKDDHLSVGEIGSYFGSGVTHELLLDYSCDGSVDAGKVFTTPYYSILPKADGADVLLSEYLEVPEAGLHCFAFEVDTENKIPETNEQNNVSAWREFIAGFGADTATSTALPSLNFEVSAYTENYASQVHDWTSEDITIAPGQELAFRWDAPAYEQCVPLLSSLTPDVASNVTPVDRNTLSENIDLHEHTGYYELRCVSGDAVKVETVYVEVE